MTTHDKIFTWCMMAGARAVRTIAQTLLSMIGTAAVFSQVDWKYALEASLFAGVISLLTSFVSLPEFDSVSADEMTTGSDRSDPEGVDGDEEKESESDD